MPKNARGGLANLLLSNLLAVAGLWGQSTAVSQISGTVRDAGGLVVPGAQVSITQTATGLNRSVQTDSEGAYTLPSLPPGPYRLTISKTGFSSYVQAGIVLQVDSNPVIDASLQVGAVSQEVLVQADASMVETHSTGVGQVVDQQRVVELPLNGRNPTQLVFLAGAATAGQATTLNSNKNYPTVIISVAGGQSNGGVSYLLDGAMHNDPFNNLNQPLPFPDALQEFKVETSALPAQYGYHSAAAVNAVTKSGGNQFHGDAFEFLRNGDFNARNFFATSRDSLKRNQFGGTFGGPIRKNKLFFFAGYQGTIQRSDPTTGIGFVPTPAMLAGNFTAITSPACNAGRQIQLKTPFNDNQIAPSLFSPAALNLIQRLPKPTDDCGTVRFGTVSNSTEHLGVLRVDYQINEKHTLFARYYIPHLEQSSSYNNNNPMTVTSPFVTDNLQFVVLGDTWLINSNTISSFHASLNRESIQKGSPPFFTARDLGVNMTPLVPGFVVIQVTGAFNAGSNGSPPGHVFSTSPQVTEDISLVRGSHQIAFGANWIRTMENYVINLAGFGNFNFNGQATGLSMGDLLTGKLNTFQQANAAQVYQRPLYVGLYAQDSWKIVPRLTLSYGLRWEPFFPISTKNGFVNHFDPSLFAANVHSSVYPQGPAGVTFPGDPGYPDKAGYFGKKADFAPRIGIVWDPRGDGRMTIRSSYGIFYDLPPAQLDYQYALSPPYGDSVTLTSPAGGFDNPWLGFSGGNPFPTQLGKNAFFPTGATYINIPLHVQPTYLEQWNVSVQKQIGNNWLASASYLGNRSVHLWTSAQANPAVYIPGSSTTGNTDARRVLSLENSTQGAYFSSLYQLDDGGTGSYNGMLLSIQRRMANGVTVLANYTWSHCISDPAVSVLATAVNYMVPGDRRADRGNCPTSDVRHVLNLSAVAQSPRFSERWLDITAGHWQFSTIVSAQSGNFFNVTTGVDNALTGQSNQRPNLIGNAIPADQNVNQWLLPAAFQSAPAGTYGNLGINRFEGPGSLQFDMGLSRLFPIREQKKIELRGEAFNVLNRLNPSNPTSALNSANFGKILAASDPRIIQLALKLVF
ncbi:MAG TPA: carboxypeptidase regulatory-like domain-containing protein [Bryobacteraceae bacterium]|jgi:hypothetical protein|nr:carboxypeptidase regulatory-like domain-containing protein [Bryobacteraceae bacterium]